MQVTVFGASGKVGRLVVAELLERGQSVVAFVHSNNPLSAQSGLTVIKGDTANVADVAKALISSQAVISCLGSWGQPGRNVLTTAMDVIIPAMEEQDIKRIVTLTGSGALAPDVVPSFGHKLAIKLLSPFPAGKVFHDGEQHMKLLASSTLDWTSLRSPIMKNDGSSTYTLDEKPASAFGRLPRSAVVMALVDQLETQDYLHRAPVINPGT